jgi:hypothetical protein
VVPGSAEEGVDPPCSLTQRLTASAAPLRICRPSVFRPDMRVVALNGTNTCSGPRASPRPSTDDNAAQ